jgi:hypothetical protein
MPSGVKTAGSLQQTPGVAVESKQSMFKEPKHEDQGFTLAILWLMKAGACAQAGVAGLRFLYAILANNRQIG